MSEELKPCPLSPERAIEILWGEVARNQQPLHCTRKELCDAIEIAEEAIRRAQQPNEPLTLEELRKINEERVWIQFRGLGMYGLVAYRSDPDGDDGDNVYITNNLGGRDTFEEILDQGGTVYARPPEAGEKG